MSKIVVNKNYRDFLSKISSIIDDNRSSCIRQINSIITRTYWEIGRMIVEEEQKGEERAEYGKFLIKKLSADLSKKFGRGFDIGNIKNMRQFYLTYSILYSPKQSRRKSYAVRSQLSWTHFRLLMRVEGDNARKFYEIECAKNKWSTRELERQINSLLFERLSLSRDKKKVKQLAKVGQLVEKPEDIVKNPYVLEFLGIPEKSYYIESTLEQKLIDHLQDFILELGNGFTFVARQKRITVDNEHYYIDLVFYHRILRCLVLIDLKIGKIEHGDIGQMNFYLNYMKDREMLEGENPPVGIVLCTETSRSKVFVEYALGGLANKVFISKYKLFLPSKEELESEIRKEEKRIREEMAVYEIEDKRE